MRSSWLLLCLSLFLLAGCQQNKPDSLAAQVARISKSEGLPESNKSIPEVRMEYTQGYRMERVALQNRMFPIGGSSESVDSSDPYDSYRTADYRLVRVGTGEVGLEFGHNGHPEKTWILGGAKDVKMTDAKSTDPLGVKVLTWKQGSQNPNGTPGKHDFTFSIVVPSWNGDAWIEGVPRSERMVKMVPANPPKTAKKSKSKNDGTKNAKSETAPNRK
jgi:hypothetical protein